MRRAPTSPYTRAPTASRTALVPTQRTISQFFFVPKFFKRLGGASRLLITISSEPSFPKSPTASPLEAHASLIPDPALFDMSLNFPPPALQYNNLGCRYL